jgi:hypothetical protein
MMASWNAGLSVPQPLLSLLSPVGYHCFNINSNQNVQGIAFQK